MKPLNAVLITWFRNSYLIDHSGGCGGIVDIDLQDVCFVGNENILTINKCFRSPVYHNIWLLVWLIY